MQNKFGFIFIFLAFKFPSHALQSIFQVLKHIFHDLEHIFHVLKYKITHDSHKKIQARPCGRACTLLYLLEDITQPQEYQELSKHQDQTFHSLLHQHYCLPKIRCYQKQSNYLSWKEYLLLNQQ